MMSGIQRTLDALRAFDIEWVVPAHGRIIRSTEAAELGRQDIDYLLELQAAARRAEDDGLPSGPAVLATYAVEPPRPTRHDFEVYEVRTSNARWAITDAAGDAAPAVDAR